jgi:hypothetical protein
MAAVVSPRSTTTRTMMVVILALLSLLLFPQGARATTGNATCARALYAPAVARPGSTFWAIAQFDGPPPNLAGGCSGDCGVFAAASNFPGGPAAAVVIPKSLRA